MGLQIDFAHLSAKDVLDLAIAAEAEAKENYEQIATWMKGRGNVEVAVLSDLVGKASRWLYAEDPA